MKYWIVSVVIIVLFFVVFKEIVFSNDVYIKKIEFEDGENNEVYVKFDINNPTDNIKGCLLNITISDKLYAGYADINANSKETYRVLVDMPKGITNVQLDYVCS